jgi:hypothetical protein
MAMLAALVFATLAAVVFMPGSSSATPPELMAHLKAVTGSSGGGSARSPDGDTIVVKVHGLDPNAAARPGVAFDLDANGTEDVNFVFPTTTDDKGRLNLTLPFTISSAESFCESFYGVDCVLIAAVVLQPTTVRLQGLWKEIGP